MQLAPAHWMESLEEDELGFVKQFILTSGSLKELASKYDVSYPTVRLRLDRLIQKIGLLDKLQDRSETERKLRAFYAEGQIPEAVFKSLLSTAKKEIK